MRKNLGNRGFRLMVDERKTTGIKKEGREMSKLGEIGYEELEQVKTGRI